MTVGSVGTKITPLYVETGIMNGSRYQFQKDILQFGKCAARMMGYGTYGWRPGISGSPAPWVAIIGCSFLEEVNRQLRGLCNT